MDKLCLVGAGLLALIFLTKDNETKEEVSETSNINELELPKTDDLSDTSDVDELSETSDMNNNAIELDDIPISFS